MSKYQCKNVIASGHTTVNLSRLSLLKWVNNVLGTKIEKVEALGSGAAYCQMFNILFPGCIPLKKVKFEAIQSHDFWINFKLLQMGFRAVGCEKEILIDTLIKGKFLDNFEFLQWFKRFYDLNYDESTISKPVKDPQTSAPKKVPSRKIITVYTPAEKEMKLKTELAEYQGKLEKVIEEKDFYLNKLRNIENLCTAEGAALTDKEYLVNKITAELYATAEGFEPPEGPQEESQDEPQEESEDKPQESEDKPQEESQDEPQEESEDKPQEESEDKPQEESEDKPQEESEDKPQEESEDKPQEESEDKPQEESEDKPQEESEDEPKVESQDEPQVESQDEPQVESQDEPQVESQDEPQVESQDE